MKLKIEIVMENAAFGEDSPARACESARILRRLAEELEANLELSDAGDHCTLRDINGNSVGKAKVTK